MQENFGLIDRSLDEDTEPKLRSPFQFKAGRWRIRELGAEDRSPLTEKIVL